MAMTTELGASWANLQGAEGARAPPGENPGEDPDERSARRNLLSFVWGKSCRSAYLTQGLCVTLPH